MLAEAFRDHLVNEIPVCQGGCRASLATVAVPSAARQKLATLIRHNHHAGNCDLSGWPIKYHHTPTISCQPARIRLPPAVTAAPTTSAVKAPRPSVATAAGVRSVVPRMRPATSVTVLDDRVCLRDIYDPEAASRSVWIHPGGRQEDARPPHDRVCSRSLSAAALRRMYAETAHRQCRRDG